MKYANALDVSKQKKTEVEKIKEEMKKEVPNRTDQLVRMNLHEINLVKSIVYKWYQWQPM